MITQGQDKISSPLANYTIKKARASEIQDTTHVVSQKIFRAKACSGIDYTFSDKLKKTLIWIIKLALFPITFPADYFIKRFAVQLSIANEGTKTVSKKLVHQLEELRGEHIDFEAEDGVKLKGMMFNNSQEPRSGKTILICSGSHKSQESYNVPIVKALLALGHNVMTFNYRGFGFSDGKASESGLYMDGGGCLSIYS